MDSLCNYGSDEDQSNSKPSVNIGTDRHTEQDVNYEPVTMDMSEDSNEEEYYARKYGKYADVAAAAQAQRFDPYEDDVSDAPTSPEPDPPTGSHERDPKVAHTTAQPESRTSNGAPRQNQFGNNTKTAESSRTSVEQTRRNNEREGGEAPQPKQQHGYGSYYERAKRKLSGGDDEEEYEQYDDSGSYGNAGAASYPSGNSQFPPSQQRSKDHHSQYDQSDSRRSHDRKTSSRYERDRSHEKDRRRSSERRDRSRDRDSRRERDRKVDGKKKRKSSRSRSRDRKHDRKSSRRHRSSRSHSRSSRSRSRSSSRHHGSRHSKDRRSSDRDRRSSDRDRRHGSSSSRRDRDRRDREPSMGDLPRPYAPYERKPSKLQILEKLGIELKVSDQPTAPGQSPQVIVVSKAAPTSTSTHNIPPLMSTPITLGGLVPGSSTVGAAGVTPQDLLQKTIAAQVEKIKADTGIELPKYYNPMAINPTKYAEQIQKRRLLWGNKQSTSTTTSTTSNTTQSQVTTSQSATSMPADSTAGGAGSGTIWQGATFSGDQDGRLTNKFQRLMGMKHAGVTVSSTTPASDTTINRRTAAATSSSSSSGGTDLIRKQEEMFNSMESQYEAARLATHTHRGLGLGFGTFAPR